MMANSFMPKKEQSIYKIHVQKTKIQYSDLRTANNGCWNENHFQVNFSTPRDTGHLKNSIL